MLRLDRKHSWIAYGIRLRRLMLSQQVDIVHAQNAFYAAIAIIFLAFTRVKVVTTLHGLGFEKANPLYRRLVYRHSSRLICVSESERAVYLNHGSFGVADRFVLIKNGVNFDKFGYVESAVAENGTLRLCMVGNFVPEKNQYFVCRFLRELDRNTIPFIFYFIGRQVPNHREY